MMKFTGAQSFWSNWQPANCVIKGDCFCETMHFDKWLVTPSGAISNVAYLIVCFIVLKILLSLENKSDNLMQTKAYSYTYLFSLFIVFLGSGFYHTSFTFFGQWLDLFGMYMFMFFLIYYNLQLLLTWSKARFFTLYGISLIISGTILVVLPELRRYLFAIQIVVFSLTEVWVLLNRRIKTRMLFLVLAFIAFGLGFAAWVPDRFRFSWFCKPDSWFQGHSIWHLMAAISMLFLYKYFLSHTIEKKR